MTTRDAPGEGGKIRVRVDPDLIDLIPGFLENRRGDLRAMREALERDDYEAVRRVAHTVKGVGGGYGFDAMTGIARGIERAAAAGDASGVQEGVEALSGYLDRVEVVTE